MELRGDKVIAEKIRKTESGLTGMLGKTMQRACVVVVNEVKLAVTGGVDLPIRSNWHPYNAPRMNVRSGRLRSSFTSRVELHGREVIGRVGSGLKYARIHEYGGVILPRTKPNLVFPLRFSSLTGAGKYKSRQQWIATKRVEMPERAPLRTSASRKHDEVAKVFGRDTKDYINKIWGKA